MTSHSKPTLKGNPIRLFMGTKDPSGNIRGRRYARRLVTDNDGNTIKDHWEEKGSASRIWFTFIFIPLHAAGHIPGNELLQDGLHSPEP